LQTGGLQGATGIEAAVQQTLARPREQEGGLLAAGGAQTTGINTTQQQITPDIAEDTGIVEAPTGEPSQAASQTAQAFATGQPASPDANLDVNDPFNFEEEEEEELINPTR